MPTIEKELRLATGYNRMVEPRQDFLSDLATAVDSLADDDWKSLSKPAKKWANAALTAKDAGRKIIDFDPYESDISRISNSKPKEEDMARKKVRKARTKKRIPKHANGKSMGSIMISLILDDLDISRADLTARLHKAGYDPTEYYVNTLSAQIKQHVKAALCRPKSWWDRNRASVR